MKNIMKFESGAEVDKILSIGNNPVAIVVEEQTISGVTIGGRYEMCYNERGFVAYGEMSGVSIGFEVRTTEIKIGPNVADDIYNGGTGSEIGRDVTINITDLEYLDKKYIEPWISYTPDGNVMKFNASLPSPTHSASKANEIKLGESTLPEFSYVGEYVVYDTGERWDVKDMLRAMPSYEYRQPFFILYEWRNGSGRVYTEKRNPKPGDRLYDRYYYSNHSYVNEILEYGGGPRIDYNQTSEFTPGPIIGPIVPNNPI